MSKFNKKNAYSVFCDNIYSQFKNGMDEKGLQWFADWKPNLECVNGVSNSHYRGVNALNLSFNGYADSRYFTLKQAISQGYSVKNGEKPRAIIKFAYWDKKEKKYISFTDFDPENPNHTSFLKMYYVYNAEQLNGIELQPIAKAKYNIKFIKDLCEKIGVKLVEGSQHENPCYVPSQDTIYIPNSALFKSQKGLYATALHEISHATGHALRQNRQLFSTKGSRNYAFEELVAEMSSAILCNYYNLENSVDKNHVAYVKSWLDLCEKDNKILVKAYKLAEESASYVVSCQKGEYFEFKSELVEIEINEPKSAKSQIAKPKSEKVTTKATKTKKVKAEKVATKVEEDKPKKVEFIVLADNKKNSQKAIGYIREVEGIKIGVTQSVYEKGKLETTKGLWRVIDINSGIMFGTCKKYKEATELIDSQIAKLKESHNDKIKTKKLHERLTKAPLLA